MANMSDDEIWALNRGGHDPHKVYAAYYEAVNNADGRPTVILAKTIKGYGMGQSGEAQNVAHQAKKMDKASLKQFRDRFGIKVTDEQIESGDLPYIRFAEDSEEMKYLRERRFRRTAAIQRRPRIFNHNGICPRVGHSVERQANRQTYRTNCT